MGLLTYATHRVYRVHMAKKKLTGWHAGRAIRIAREDDGLTVDQLAQRLSEISDSPWYGAKVSRIERGEQDLRASEVNLFRRVQDRSLEWYFDGPTPTGVGASRVNPGYLNRVAAVFGFSKPSKRIPTLPTLSPSF